MSESSLSSCVDGVVEHIWQGSRPGVQGDLDAQLEGVIEAIKRKLKARWDAAQNDPEYHQRAVKFEREHDDGRRS